MLQTPGMPVHFRALGTSFHPTIQVLDSIQHLKGPSEFCQWPSWRWKIKKELPHNTGGKISQHSLSSFQTVKEYILLAKNQKQNSFQNGFSVIGTTLKFGAPRVFPNSIGDMQQKYVKFICLLLERQVALVRFGWLFLGLVEQQLKSKMTVIKGRTWQNSIMKVHILLLSGFERERLENQNNCFRIVHFHTWTTDKGCLPL